MRSLLFSGGWARVGLHFGTHVGHSHRPRRPTSYLPNHQTTKPPNHQTTKPPAAATVQGLSSSTCIPERTRRRTGSLGKRARTLSSTRTAKRSTALTTPSSSTRVRGYPAPKPSVFDPAPPARPPPRHQQHRYQRHDHTLFLPMVVVGWGAMGHAPLGPRVLFAVSLAQCPDWVAARGPALCWCACWGGGGDGAGLRSGFGMMG